MNKMEWLDAFGYEINPDPDQPGKWLWGHIDGGASKISFDTREEAIANARRHFLTLY